MNQVASGSFAQEVGAGTSNLGQFDIAPGDHLISAGQQTKRRPAQGHQDRLERGVVTDHYRYSAG